MQAATDVGAGPGMLEEVERTERRGVQGLSLEKSVVQDNVPAEVVRGLYIGSIHAAFNQEFLHANHITHIVNASGLPATFPKKFTYLSVDVRDKEWADLMSVMPLVNIFVGNVLQHRGVGVLVHCSGGRSRSAALCCAYLMHTRGVTFEDAYRCVIQARPVCNINKGFEMQLRAYDRANCDLAVASQMLLRLRIERTRDRVLQEREKAAASRARDRARRDGAAAAVIGPPEAEQLEPPIGEVLASPASGASTPAGGGGPSPSQGRSRDGRHVCRGTIAPRLRFCAVSNGTAVAIPLLRCLDRALHCANCDTRVLHYRSILRQDVACPAVSAGDLDPSTPRPLLSHVLSAPSFHGGAPLLSQEHRRAYSPVVAKHLEPSTPRGRGGRLGRRVSGHGSPMSPRRSLSARESEDGEGEGGRSGGGIVLRRGLSEPVAPPSGSPMDAEALPELPCETPRRGRHGLESIPTLTLGALHGGEDVPRPASAASLVSLASLTSALSSASVEDEHLVDDLDGPRQPHLQEAKQWLRLVGLLEGQGEAAAAGALNPLRSSNSSLKSEQSDGGFGEESPLQSPASARTRALVGADGRGVAAVDAMLEGGGHIFVEPLPWMGDLRMEDECNGEPVPLHCPGCSAQLGVYVWDRALAQEAGDGGAPMGAPPFCRIDAKMLRRPPSGIDLGGCLAQLQQSEQVNWRDGGPVSRGDEAIRQRDMGDAELLRRRTNFRKGAASSPNLMPAAMRGARGKHFTFSNSVLTEETSRELEPLERLPSVK